MTDLPGLLERTSRTFALSIPLLPEPTRLATTLAYLLFRLADTFEDAAVWPRARRAEALTDLLALLADTPVAPRARATELSLRWSAAVLGAKEVNTFELGQVSVVNDIALVVRRFDRGAKGEKLRLEDFAQILCKPRGRDYGGKYDGAYEDVAAIIRQHSARPAIDLARFFRRLIVFALVGNCDAHLKNFSLLEAREGLRLSPAYDILNTVIYDGYDQELALSIGGRKVHFDSIDGEVFRAFGKDVGLQDRAIQQIFADLRRLVKKAARVIHPPDAEAPDGFVNRYAEIVSNACLRILGD